MDPAGRERLYHLLQTAAHRLKIRADRDSQRAAGVTAAQAALMFVIAHVGGPTQRRVAEELRLNESAVTGMIGRLINAGYVSRSPSPTDGRAWTLALTAKGEDSLERFRQQLDMLNREITSAIGGDEAVVGFVEALRKLLEIRPDSDGSVDS